MHVRLVQLPDIPAITALGKQLLTMHTEFDPNYYALEQNFDELFGNWAKEHVNHPSQFILVADNGAGSIVGFISGFIKQLYPWFITKKVGHLAYLIVDPAHQQNGIGASLENEARSWFKVHSVSYVEVYTDCANPIGQKAWQKYGYADFKRFLRKKIIQ